MSLQDDHKTPFIPSGNVNTTTELFPSWLKHIPGELYQLDEKPLLGYPPAFPWAAFSSNLTQSLQISSLSLTPGNLQWRTQAELFSGLGDRIKTLSFVLSPLDGSVWWVMPEESLFRLMHLLVGTEIQTSSEIDESFSKAFTQFLAAEACNAFEKVDFDKKLIPLVQKETSLPGEACLGLDITITLGNETFYGRLLLSQSFRKSWTQRYALQQKTLALSSPIADSLEVIVHLEAGKIDLKPSEWKQIVPGDFVIIDKCSLDPDQDKGRVMLVINGSPFFRAQLKQGSLKILEHPLYHEVDTAMDTPSNKNEEEAFDDSDFDLDEEHTTDHTTDHDTDSSEYDATTSEYDATTTEHDATTTGHGEDTDLSDIEDSKTPVPAGAKQKTAEKPALIPTTASNIPLSVNEIPLSVVIEVGRIQLSVKKLLELQPGNMLDLNISPESGVDMVINGKRIARGELLKIGDSLGIRILELS